MTEGKWLSSTDPTEMLSVLLGKSSDRKLRLFACACTRRVLDLMDNRPVGLKTVEFAERFADGLATRNELRGRAWGNPGEAFSAVLWDARAAAENAAEFGAERQSRAATFLVEGVDQSGDVRGQTARDRERETQSVLLRDIFGNPFRPVAFELRWRTTDVVTLAQGIYDDRAFDRLPILADALMDAGCADESVLEHCRSDGPHVRGCWVVDLVLGKT
jgi:hypothetical protein